jgi:hypothetical protein
MYWSSLSNYLEALHVIPIGSLVELLIPIGHFISNTKVSRQNLCKQLHVRILPRNIYSLSSLIVKPFKH